MVQRVVNDKIVPELTLIHRVHFYVCEQCAPGGDKEWCHPGAGAEGYSQADGNLRISPPPSGTLPQVMLQADHLKLLRDEVGYNVERRMLDHESEGYRGYWEVIRWAGRDFRTIFKYKSFAFGLRCPTEKAIQWVKSPSSHGVPGSPVPFRTPEDQLTRVTSGLGHGTCFIS